MTDDSPTLTFNTIARHQSMMVSTRIASTKSPWLAGCEVGDIHKIAISHGEGRFVASPELIKSLADNGQIATQYVDLEGAPSMDIRFNPNSRVSPPPTDVFSEKWATASVSAPTSARMFPAPRIRRSLKAA